MTHLPVCWLVFFIAWQTICLRSGVSCIKGE
jgi:hypothetical protein